MVPQDVDEIIAGLIHSEEAGESVDREAMLVAHPQHADALRQFFADRDSVGRLLTPILHTKRMPLPARLRYFGDYEVIDEIASGGMGVVYRARQKTLDRIVAVKMIKSGQLAGEEDIRRFQIPMNDSLVMCRLHGAGELFHQFGGGTRRLGLALEPVFQTTAFDEFQREIGPAFVFTDVMDLDNVRML